MLWFFLFFFFFFIMYKFGGIYDFKKNSKGSVEGYHGWWFGVLQIFVKEIVIMQEQKPEQQWTTALHQ